MGNGDSSDGPNRTPVNEPKIRFTENDLRKRLSPLQYAVTQEKFTERPFTGEYNEHDDLGHYQCVVCDQPLFSSDTKFPTSCGWPGFKRPVAPDNVDHTLDKSHNMVRTEVTCSRCQAHLGHVFDDGPYPERTRYCINSAALKFIRRR